MVVKPLTLATRFVILIQHETSGIATGPSTDSKLRAGGVLSLSFPVKEGFEVG
ncbi:hypothetical protein M1O13_01385 [Dehalococcoidia bacterium]|nr:hypothetical protein [Dehalococcoidia bacterium]